VQEEMCIEIIGRKPDEKEPIGRIRHRWKDNIKTDLREIG
jgi:hypothetical protein